MPASALNYVGNVTKNTLAKAREILSAAENAGHSIKIIYGFNPASRPEHSSGRALDFMVYKDRAAGDFIADYAWKNRARLKVKWIIWRQRIISSGRAGEGWRWMADRGNSTVNHMDHPHIFFDDGYSAPAVPIEPINTGIIRGNALWIGQQLVKHGFDRHYRMGPSNDWGPADEANLREFQMIIMGKYDNLGQADHATHTALDKPLFTSSARHATEHHTPIDVRLLKFATLRVNSAPMEAQRSPDWWNDSLARSDEYSKDIGRLYIEAQWNFQVNIGDDPDGKLGPKQYALLGKKSKAFNGVA